MKFRVVIADPPWSFRDSLAMSAVRRGAASQYATLSTADLCEMPVGDWCEPTAVLALWTPAALLADGLAVMKAWRFSQKQVVVWVKRTRNGLVQMGMGRQFRSACEVALIGTRGSPVPAARNQRNIFEAPCLAHSRKPDDLHTMLERMYPGGPFLELFARRAVPGWTCVGMECEDGVRADLRDWRPPLCDAVQTREMQLFPAPVAANG